MNRICIIGAGISGLSIASEKKKLGKIVKVFESANRIGGVIESEEIDGYLLDYGANTLNVRLKSTKERLENCGAWDSCIDANLLANKRMIVRDGKIVDLPHSFLSFLTSPFLSIKGKLRLLAEPLVARSNEPENESVASFIKRRLGQEALDYAANPFLAGIFAANPETLILNQAFPKFAVLEKNYRSILLGLKKSRKLSDNPNLPTSRLVSFPNGMEELPEKLGCSLKNEISLSTSVKKISRNNNSWAVTVQKQTGEQTVHDFDQVISTIPSHRLDSIDWQNIKEHDELNILNSSTHHPLAMVYLGYEKKDILHPLDGFGFLVPEVEKKKILGTLFSSTLFPGRAPDGKILLTTFIGGERDPSLAQQKESTLISTAKKELTNLLKIKGEPTFQKVKKWPNAIPLPDKQMIKCKKAAQKLSLQNPGLSFSGSYLCGVSLPNCLDAC
jgi:protoporphyrinogen/coproporphyrinogen III oxidase